MENNKEKRANIDSEIISKRSSSQNISTKQLYEHGLEYAQNIKLQEDQIPKPQKRKHIGDHSPTIIN